MLLDIKKNYKILVVQMGRIGDLILLLPVIEALKKQNPNYEIHFLASRHNYQALTSHPLIDKVHIYHKGIFNIFKLLWQLRQENFDIWLDAKAHRSGESHLLARLGGAKYKIGYEVKKSIFDYVLEHDEVRPYEHITYLNTLALKPFGIEASVQRPRLYLDASFENTIKTFLEKQKAENLPTNYYCVNLSGNDTPRNWQTEKWLEFLQNLPKPHPPIVVIAAPHEKERATLIANTVPNVTYLPTESITDVFGVVAHADLVITPDTSIVHIAASFNKPLLALYVNAKPFYSKFYPLSSHFQVVMQANDGDPVSSITVEQAINGYAELMNKIG